MAGEAAPLLWHKYKQGDMNALQLLISYNHADVEGMKFIFDAVMERLVEKQELPSWGRSFYRFSEHRSEPPEWEPEAVGSLNGSFRLRPYEGKTGPAITLSDLDLGIKPLKVIGIDLTGSESRPSGWCLLDGAFAVTQRIGSDEDIIRTTMETGPSLVSIDSPLSLPVGRITVTDDDPGRKMYGITRYCERVLKKRGINVYPSLIQSMQALTARGISLARRFRELGIPVIESYPGAAQDIINIPRKRADLGLLKKGLNDFGLKGRFVDELVSHDELDAITSAIVGLFFISGRFEGLGNEEEEYLIIPDIDPEKNPWKKRKVIGLSGPISSGKTTAGKHLESLGFNYGRYSLVLKDLLQERGKPVTRESLQQIGEEIYKEPGQRWLCRELIKRMPEAGDLVIDGLRHPEDRSFLVETFGPDFLHIHMGAPESIRLKRYVADEGTKDEFLAAIAHPVEANIPKLAGLAHEVVRNTGTLEVFLSEILRIVGSADEMEEEGHVACQ
jgi:predicted nuclease with RNAse H fold/dephospho-CoA kinase